MHSMIARTDPMLDMARAAILTLEVVPKRLWAEVFVELRMAFSRRFGRGLICSISHGVDFFENVVGCCEETREWDEKGEYGANFRKMIEDRPVDKEGALKESLEKHREKLIEHFLEIESEISSLKNQIKACGVLLSYESAFKQEGPATVYTADLSAVESRLLAEVTKTNELPSDLQFQQKDTDEPGAQIPARSEEKGERDRQALEQHTQSPPALSAAPEETAQPAASGPSETVQ